MLTEVSTDPNPITLLMCKAKVGPVAQGLEGPPRSGPIGPPRSGPGGPHQGPASGLRLGLVSGDAAVQLAQARLLLDVGHLSQRQRRISSSAVGGAAVRLFGCLTDQGGFFIQPAGDGPVEVSVQSGCSQ